MICIVIPYGLAINYSGWFHHNEYRRNVLADAVTAHVIRDDKRNLFFRVNQKPMTQFILKEQFEIRLEQRKEIGR